MRIAIWSDTFPPQVNGVASVTRDSATALTELGHDVAVFTVTRASHIEHTAGGKSFAVNKISSLPMPNFIYPTGEFMIPLMPGLKTLRALKKFKPDILHTHTPFLAGWGAILGKKLLHIPLVGTHHTFYDDYLKHVKLDYSWGRKFSWKLTVAYYNRCGAVVSPSRSLGAALLKHGLKPRLHIVPNPADTDFFVPVPSAARKQRLKQKYGVGKHGIVYMGRVSYEKDIDQAIAAFSIAREHVSDATFMIVGDGPERKKLEALVKKLACESVVFFTGMLRSEELRDALWANDLFLTASRSENQPVSIIEAMACGLPVAAVDAKGIPDIVRHGKNGLLAKPDHPELLARAIVQLFKAPAGLRKKGVASHKFAERYSKKNVAHAMVELYEKIIKEKS